MGGAWRGVLLARAGHPSAQCLGLGLALVNAVARAHRADLATTARPEGGLAVTVRFPRPAPPGPGPRYLCPEAGPAVPADVA